MAELLVIQGALLAANAVIDMAGKAKECEKEADDIKHRAEATTMILLDATRTLGNINIIGANLIALTRIFEEVQDVLKRCTLLDSSSAVKKMGRYYKPLFSAEENRKILMEYSRNLDGEQQIIQAALTAAVAKQNKASNEEAKQQRDRIEGLLLRQKIVLEPTTDPGMRLAQRQLTGDVIYEELVELNEQLGSGSFGVVKAGTYRGQRVAIKMARDNLGSPQDKEIFRREARTHFYLRHDRILHVIAFSCGDNVHLPCLIMERMECTLRHFLGDKKAERALRDKLAYIIDICEGLNYLHQYKVIHRDINSYNILLDGGGAKVSDFGMSHVCSTLRSARDGKFHDKVGIHFWMAPEVHDHHEGDFDSDIFSLHVVMWDVRIRETMYTLYV